MALKVIPTPTPGVAGFEVGDEYTQVETFYGEHALVTEPYRLAPTNAAILPIYTVVGIDANGEIIPAAGGNVFGVTSTIGAPGDTIDIYREASFNDDALAFPAIAAFDSFAKRRAEFRTSKSPSLYLGRIPTHGRTIPRRTIP